MAALERGPSLTEQAAAALRARIVDGGLQLGEALSENILAAELGVSKTPVREALMQLRRDGLVEIHPRRGTFVFTMTAAQVRQLSEMRAILETAALGLAMARGRDALIAAWSEIVAAMEAALAAGDAAGYRALDGAFHRSIFELAGNAYLLEAFTGIAFRVQALRNRLSRDAALNRASFADHRRFLDLARRDDLPAILELAARHVAWTRDRYVAGMEDAAAPRDPSPGGPSPGGARGRPAG